MGLLSKTVSIPFIGKMVLKILKKRAFKPFQIPLEKALEKQNRMLEAKFKRMERIKIGKKLGVHKGVKLPELPITDYSFYEPFYNNPTSNAFMYPIKDYVRARTSGTSGTEKWFMIPRKVFPIAFRETMVPLLLSTFHDGEKITLEYGDTFYVNLAPRPFIGGLIVSHGARYGILNAVPNLNLPYHDRVRYFILNHKKIHAAAMLASTLVSQIMPVIKEPIKLKGLIIMDSVIGEIYREEIASFAGTFPKTCYVSTETIYPTIPSVQHPLSFIFDWRRGFFEFLPVEKGKVTEEELIEIEDVRPGKVYDLIYTSFEGELTRYNTGDSLLCIARGDDIIGTEYPIFKFHARLEKTISLHNFTRISESELITALRETDTPFIDFTTKVEIKGGMQYLRIYIESREGVTAEEIEERIHNQLYKMDMDYRDLVDFFKYKPIKVQLIPHGVFAKYLEGKIAGVPKVDKIKMREDEFNRFMEIMKMYEQY